MSKVEKMVVGVLVSFAIGVVLRLTGAITPIHEIGHVLCAYFQGSGARIASWNSASIDRMTNEVLVAGHYFEMIVYFVLFLVWKKKHLRAAAVAFGAFHVNIGFAMRSTDIQGQLLNRTDSFYVNDVITIWILINLALLTWGWIAGTIELRKGAAILNASERSHKRQDDFNTPSEETFFAVRREVDLMAHRRPGKKGA